MFPKILSFNIALNSEKITNLLLHEKSRHKIIKPVSSSSASLWRAFCYPATLNENNEFERITGYINCFNCMKTQVYNILSETKRFKEHADKCFPASKVTVSSSIDSVSSSSLPLTSPKQTTLKRNGFTKIKFNEKHIAKIKNLSAEWIRVDLRPFSALDDVGFRKIVQG